MAMSDHVRICVREKCKGSLLLNYWA